MVKHVVDIGPQAASTVVVEAAVHMRIVLKVVARHLAPGAWCVGVDTTTIGLFNRQSKPINIERTSVLIEVVA